MVQLTGGDKLAAKLAEISKNLQKAASVDIGFQSDAAYPDGTPVALVAAIQEFGAPRAGIPPRPFFRGMIADKSPEWPGALGKLLVANDYDAAKALGQAGDAIKGQLEEAIEVYVGPPLKPATIARKGSDKALVETGLLLKSVTRVVKE